ncbi:hypothetical protein HY988_04540 [Candidatus Micrarchaeota archaeon]|nr:hypothetical protein [Candidatus Micrarchaeota archaeon]
MVSTRSLNRTLALEKVDILFYQVIEKSGKKMLKPMKIDTQVSIKMIRAILDNTIIPTFYETLSKNLEERGVKPGTRVQLRAKFNASHALVDPVLSGTKILCEVTVE